MRIRITEMTIAIFAFVSTIQSAYADPDSWQMATLFSPSPTQLEREAKGHLVIYHGMRDIDVERAMDEQFERIETMMFTATIVTDQTGEPLRDRETGAFITEDDGC
jgi:hypothetical protein